MSLNSLLYRHQLSLMRAASVSDAFARSHHRNVATIQADQIEALSKSLGGSMVVRYA